MKRKKKYFRFSSIGGTRKVLIHTYDAALAKEKMERASLSFPRYRDLIYLGEGEPKDLHNWERYRF